ncbi:MULTISPECIES: helix-turn-helix domain-containing protein [Clostridium]|uniref:helix-turn-helix domain-containing protein n=1 Tax=Clostridium sporogenes TaxID=1509 RepID=UPI0001794F09|nr:MULTISPECIES: helix-turn-helix transcriptional regulator [Clostridium]EDU35764.1 DNA-binding helix-turn-helix protein [Clostridium sporogenes ATCC 15579]MBO0530364.1 XRE family transcriptional regulator [Clostridium botulinum]MBO0559134.1 XRE family transcriptional regulator [Clostridium botulinum]NFE66605.1 helix-turn-helix transcriptional regulator [Clostridium sporogenes]NFL75387.1 helix-turn-helix transcriptional regulator [Clostridium sporogenes]
MLKKARKTKGLSQKTLAKKLDITQSYLSRLESNAKYNKNITIGLIKKISIELELDPVDIFLYFYH